MHSLTATSTQWLQCSSIVVLQHDHQSGKQFGSRSGPMHLSGLIWAKVISRQHQKVELNRKTNQRESTQITIFGSFCYTVNIFCLENADSFYTFAAYIQMHFKLHLIMGSNIMNPDQTVLAPEKFIGWPRKSMEIKTGPEIIKLFHAQLCWAWELFC